MGEAKRRGTFESRQAAGIVKVIRKNQERAKQLADEEAAMTVEQKQKRAEARKLLTTMLGLTLGAGS